MIRGLVMSFHDLRFYVEGDLFIPAFFLILFDICYLKYLHENFRDILINAVGLNQFRSSLILKRIGI